MRYGAGIIDWTMDELRVIDRKTRKIMTMNRMYHPQSDVDRLARLVEHRTTVREVVGSNPGRTNTQGL